MYLRRTHYYVYYVHTLKNKLQTPNQRGLNHKQIFYQLLITNLFYYYFSGSDWPIQRTTGYLLVPNSYTAGNGDLHVQLHYQFPIKPTLPPKPTTTTTTESFESLESYGPSSPLPPTLSSPKKEQTYDVKLEVSKLINGERSEVFFIDVYPDPRTNVTQITISCNQLLYGGRYQLQMIGNDVDDDIPRPGTFLRQYLDVRWPVPKLSITPESIGTYPQQAIDLILEFPETECTLPKPSPDVIIPEFWLELYYCGHKVLCDQSKNATMTQMLYLEQVRGYPRTKLLKLSCELFGLAGHYIVRLRPTSPVPSFVSATAFIKVKKNCFNYP